MARTPSVTGPPPKNPRRWVASHKAAVVAAVSSGAITIEEACRRYEMSEEEFLAWQYAFESHGILGLRAGCVQKYRRYVPAGRHRRPRPPGGFFEEL